MPFAGTVEEARAAVRSLAALELDDDDELILADNCGIALDTHAETAARSAPVRVIDARGERSPAHARNAGAGAGIGTAEWILFLDADTVAPPDLLDRFFAEPIADDVGAIAGAIAPARSQPSAGIVARYGAHKNFLDAGAHLAHPFLPRAAAANLLVRRTAFDAVGGFFEGLRAAEDTDFSWRLQRAGWTLAGRPTAVVEHRYRGSLCDLRRQWRGYAAGRAWLGRRYDGFEPQPALLRAVGRTVGRAASRVTRSAIAPSAPCAPPGRPAPCATRVSQVPAPGTVSGSVAARDKVRFAALDLILGVEELIGFALSNRPTGAPAAELTSGRVLVADRFPAAGNDQRGAAGPVRIEAGGRAERAASSAGVTVVYREDDGPLDLTRAFTTLIARRPGGVLAAAARYRDAPSPVALAPAACRLLADADVTLSPSSDDRLVRAATHRLGLLAGREQPRRDGWREMLTRRARSSSRTPSADGQRPKIRRR